MRGIIPNITFYVFPLFLILTGCGGDGGNSKEQLTGGCRINAIANGQKCGSGRGPVAFLAIYSGGSGYSGQCTGTFITRDKILTAAHCVDGARSIAVVSGDYKSEVVRAVQHPGWRKGRGREFDVAVLTVSQPADDIAPLPIIGSFMPEPGGKIRVMGYGLDQHRVPISLEEIPNMLKGAEMVISGVDGHYFYSTFATSDAAICFGDSGGPAVGTSPVGLPGILGINHAIYAPIDRNGFPICDHREVVSIFISVPRGEILDFILRLAPGAAVV